MAILPTGPLATKNLALREPMFIPTSKEFFKESPYVKPGLTETNFSLEALQEPPAVTAEDVGRPVPAKGPKGPAKTAKTCRAGQPGIKDKAAGDSIDSRWWTRSRQLLLCPLTNFPIQFLPYPPFKLRVDPSKSSPHTLVDGKFLVLQLIVHGRSGPGIRELLPSDITALDEYIQRCKLGPFRPGVARGLAEEMTKATSDVERTRAAKELQQLRAKSRSELGKLRRIQDNRLAQLAAQEEKHVEETEEKETPAVENTPPQEDAEIPVSNIFGPIPMNDFQLKRLQL